MAALAIALVSGCAHLPTGGLSVTHPDERAVGKGSISMSLTAPGAENVVLILMSTHDPAAVPWEVKATKRGDGTWSAYFDLMPGEYRYFFMVDGVFTVAQGSGQVVTDDFGGKTGVLNVVRDPSGSLSTF